MISRKCRPSWRWRVELLMDLFWALYYLSCTSTTYRTWFRVLLIPFLMIPRCTAMYSTSMGAYNYRQISQDLFCGRKHGKCHSTKKSYPPRPQLRTIWDKLNSIHHQSECLLMTDSISRSMCLMLWTRPERLWVWYEHVFFLSRRGHSAATIAQSILLRAHLEYGNIIWHPPLSSRQAWGREDSKYP